MYADMLEALFEVICHAQRKETGFLKYKLLAKVEDILQAKAFAITQTVQEVWRWKTEAKANVSYFSAQRTLTAADWSNDETWHVNEIDINKFNDVIEEMWDTNMWWQTVS